MSTLSKWIGMVAAVVFGGAGIISIASFFLPNGMVPERIVTFGYFGIGFVIVVFLGAFVHRGIDKRRVASIYSHLDAGQLEQALPEIEMLLHDFEAMAGPSEPVTMYWRHILADTNFRVGRLSDAIRLAKANLDLRTRALGKTDPDTLKSQGLYESIRRAIGE